MHKRDTYGHLGHRLRDHLLRQSFNPFVVAGDVLNSAKSGEFVARLLSDYSPGFVIRNVNVPVVGAPSDHYAMRISTHLWTSVDDIDRLVAAMYDLSRKMG